MNWQTKLQTIINAYKNGEFDDTPWIFEYKSPQSENEINSNARLHEKSWEKTFYKK
jgi:hypothetical protein